jgi:oligopeptidase B
VRIDDYYWLRDRDDPDVLAYLQSENEYVDECLGSSRERQDALFSEIKGRIKQTDVSVPYREGTHQYYWRYEDGREYRIYCRKPVDGEAEHVMLDVNTVAKGHEYCDVGSLVVSPDERLLGYAVDTVGRRLYDIRFLDLETGAMLGDVIPNVTGNYVWANDNRTLFYARQHETTLRSYQIYRHRLGQDTSMDALVYEEVDETFSCGVGKSRSKRFILIGTYQTLTTEYHVLDADQPDRDPRRFLRREPGHEYHLDHFEGRFFVRSNAGARNFRLLETDDNPDRWAPDHWQELVPHRDNVLIETFELFRDYLVLEERTEGLVRLRIRSWEDGTSHDIEFPEPAYEAYIDANNRIPDSTVLRFGYSSLSTPASDYDYDMVTRTRTLLKREEVLGGFDAADYRTERLYASATDGVRVPISLVSRRDTPLDGSAPLLLYGYGSYGISMDADFRSPRLSLLDRGYVFAIAHVRGGQELGRQWYDDGKLLKKKNTFTDFIACAEHLVRARYSSHSRMFAMGGSAGGLLMGAVCNMRPDLFHGVIAHVPFVDVLTTMLDESIPLTTGEYDEWGNPNDPVYYDYIKEYSPYDNVGAEPYPHLLVMTGLHDSQVQYWEPAKWVAKLRSLETDDRLLLLKTNMDAGHGGASGRYRRYRETALQYAFLLALASPPE